MDPYQRDSLTVALRDDMMRSADMMLKASRHWTIRNNQLKAQYGDDTPELLIEKGRDLRLKEYMGVYTWHRDNVNACANALLALASIRSEETEIDRRAREASIAAQRRP